MKQAIRIWIGLIALSLSLKLQAQTPSLDSIQGQIDVAMGMSFQKRNPEPLEQIEAKLTALKGKHAYANYWINFVQYYKAIYALKSGQRSEAKDQLDQVIKKLETRELNSEEYALKAQIYGLMVSLSPGMQAGAWASKLTEAAETALELNENNMRAWLMLASSDFHTPKSFGGGKKVLKYLNKALKASESPSPSGAPTWGKDQVYELLIRYYHKQGKLDKAKAQYEQLKQEFPYSHVVYSLAGLFSEK